MEVLYGCAPFWERLFTHYLVPAERVTGGLAWPLLRRRAPTCGARPRRVRQPSPSGGMSWTTLRHLLQYGAAHGTPAFLPWLWAALSAVQSRGPDDVFIPESWDAFEVSRLVGLRGDVVVAAALHAIEPGFSANWTSMMHAAAVHDCAALLDWCLTRWNDNVRTQSGLILGCMREACSSDAAGAMRVLVPHMLLLHDHCAVYQQGLCYALMAGAARVLDCLFAADIDMYGLAMARTHPCHAVEVVNMLRWCSNQRASVAWLEAHFDVLACANAVLASPTSDDAVLLDTAIAYIAPRN